MTTLCYTKFPKELDHKKKVFINIQNIDNNGYFRWCLVRFLHPVNHNPKGITRPDKDLAKELAFKDIQFPIKIIGIRKIRKKNCVVISVLVIKTR